MLDITAIMGRLPHRYPFLFVDRVLELEPGRRAVGLKNVTINEPFFVGHYPGRPIMPGVLILEAMAQVGGLAAYPAEDFAGKVPLFAGVERARFRKVVVPGDQLRIEATVTRARGTVSRIEAVALVDGARVAEAELLFALADPAALSGQDGR